MAEVAADTLPENMVQAVIGRGALGQALAEHSGVDAVGFTGSVAVGKRVAIAAAGHLVEVSLELGAKNPAVLNDASDLDRALDQILLATFAACGQRCTAVSQVIVHRDLEEGLVRACRPCRSNGAHGWYDRGGKNQTAGKCVTVRGCGGVRDPRRVGWWRSRSGRSPT